MFFDRSSSYHHKTDTNKTVTSTKKIHSYFCDHCKTHGHSLERCWKVYGYPTNWKRNDKNPPYANIVRSENIYDKSLVTTTFTQPNFSKFCN